MGNATHALETILRTIMTFIFRTLELCLTEVAKCDFFIGMLGERYGWVPQSYVVPDDPKFDWVRRLITQLVTALAMRIYL